MTKTDQIIENYLKGNCSEEELILLLNFLQENPENLQYFKNKQVDWENNQNKTFSLKEWEAWTRLKNKITDTSANKHISYRIKFYKVASIVAIVLLTSVLGSIPLLQKQKVAITTQPGQIINIALPDSSSVTLNSNSSLEYHPLAFILKREIHLKGEAYFDIRKKKNIPFRVNCNTLNIKVTGTRFNVDAYDQNESYKIVLEEGSVKVKPKKDHHPAVELSPGEKLEIDKTSLKHSIEKVNTRFYTSWKEGILYFYDSTFEEVIERIGSRYGAKIIIKDDLINHFVISTTIKDEPLEKILDLFKKVLPVTINETEGTIYFHLDHERYKKFKNKSPS